MKYASLLLLLGLIGCKSDATQVLVVVETDLLVPTEMDKVHARILDQKGQGIAPKSEADFSVASAGAIPFSFGVAPEGDPGGVLVVSLDAIRPGGGKIFEVRAVTEFQEGKTLLLPMFLLRTCAGITCQAGETCRNGSCGSDDYGVLDEVVSGQEVMRVIPPAPTFADAAVTPDPDAMPADDASSRDAGVADARIFADAMVVMASDATPFADAMGGFADAGPMMQRDAAPGPADAMAGPPTCPTLGMDCNLNLCPPGTNICRCDQPGNEPTPICIPACVPGSIDCPNGFTCDAMGHCIR